MKDKIMKVKGGEKGIVTILNNEGVPSIHHVLNLKKKG